MVVFSFFSKVFGMTASPTVECVQVLQSKAYVCEDDLIEEYQANAQWELLFYKVRHEWSRVVHASRRHALRSPCPQNFLRISSKGEGSLIVFLSQRSALRICPARAAPSISVSPLSRLLSPKICSFFSLLTQLLPRLCLVSPPPSPFSPSAGIHHLPDGHRRAGGAHARAVLKHHVWFRRHQGVGGTRRAG